MGEIKSSMGVFQRFLNCANGTKSRKASHLKKMLIKRFNGALMLHRVSSSPPFNLNSKP